MPQSRYLFLPVCLAWSLLTACRSVPDRLAERSTEIATLYQKQAALRETLPDTVITWDEALRRLKQDNLSLREARDSLTSAQERLRQIYKDLLPGANLTANLTHSITDLSNLKPSDGSLALIGFINFPGLIRFRLDILSANLELIRARWAYELREREQVIRLREQFLRAEVIGQREQSLRRSLAWEVASSPRQTLEADPESLARDNALWSVQRDYDALQNSFAELIGDNTRRWLPDRTGAPAFDYIATPPDLADMDRYGVLYRQLQALEIEAASLSEKGVKLQYWPDLRVNLTAPPLYSASGNRSRSIRADDILLNLSTSLPIDIRGNIAQQVRATRRRNQILLARMELDRAQTIERLAVARDTLMRNQQRLRLTELRLAALRDTPLIQSPLKLRENLDRLLRLDEQRTQLLLENAQYEGLLWLFDETRWQRPDWTRRVSANP